MDRRSVSALSQCRTIEPEGEGEVEVVGENGEEDGDLLRHH